MVDITERKLGEIELINAKEEMMAAVSQNWFCIGHEIRTPLNGIIGFTDLCDFQWNQLGICLR
jgi:signal transduction histidine kinase